MAFYTVHQNYDLPDEDDRTVLVREGFAWIAFLIPGLWLIYHREYLALLGYVAAMALLAAAYIFLAPAEPIVWAIGVGIHLLIAFEANDVRRFFLNRDGYELQDVVSGFTLVRAERRFFAEQDEAPIINTEPPSAPASSAPKPPKPKSSKPKRTERAESTEPIVREPTLSPVEAIALDRATKAGFLGVSDKPFAETPAYHRDQEPSLVTSDPSRDVPEILAEITTEEPSEQTKSGKPRLKTILDLRLSKADRPR